MPIKNCYVEFISEHGVFFSGDVVKGYVHLTLNEPKNVSELELKLTGGAKCSWTETYSTGSGTVTVYYSGEETYFTVTNNLLTGKFPQKDGCSEIPAGTHKFDFSAYVPPEALTSFEGLYGKIRYSARVAMKRPGKFDKCSKAYFTVLRHYNLNYYSNLKQPLEVKHFKNFHVLFAKTGRLNLRTNLSCTGFVPGQNISFECQMHNDSKVSISEVKFSLNQRSTYYVKSPYKKSRYFKKRLSEYKSGGLEKGEEKQYGVNLYVPAVPPSSDRNIPTILTIDYFIKIKAFVSGVHKNFRTKIPIEIGTVPFMTLGESSTASAPDYVDYAPPTYEEAEMEMMMKEKKEDEEEDLSEYVPRYPVFQFTSEKSGIP